MLGRKGVIEVVSNIDKGRPILELGDCQIEQTGYFETIEEEQKFDEESKGILQLLVLGWYDIAMQEEDNAKNNCFCNVVFQIATVFLFYFFYAFVEVFIDYGCVI